MIKAANLNKENKSRIGGWQIPDKRGKRQEKLDVWRAIQGNEVMVTQSPQAQER